MYIVPLNFGYEIKDDTYVFNFYGAKEGRKIDLFQKNPDVGFEMDTDYALKVDDITGNYSTYFRRIIGNGVLSIISEPEEKKQGRSLLMEHNTGKKEWDFDEETLNTVTVFKLVVHKMSCKEH